MLTFQLAVVLVIIQCIRVYSRCLEGHLLYERKNKETNLCYAFINPVHIGVLRKISNVWGDNHEMTGTLDQSVIRTYKQASDGCKGLKDYPRLDSTEMVGVLNDAKEQRMAATFQAFGQRGLEPEAADPRDFEQLRWILLHAYFAFGLRTGSWAFIGNLKTFYPPAVQKAEPKLLDGVTVGYNRSNSTDAAGIMRFDPGRPDLEGIVWVDHKQPYGRYLLPWHRVDHLICEYNEAKDCQMVPMEPSKCVPDERTLACTWFDFRVKVPGNVYGAPCHPAVKNRTVKCPWHRREQCKSDCQWAEWSLTVRCPKKKCPAKEIWTRAVKRDAIHGGKICEDGDDLKEIDCPCEGKRP